MAEITGTNGDDNGVTLPALIGTADDDVISGLDGNDSLNGLAGSNTLFGGSGNDTLFGLAHDSLSGGDGDDYFRYLQGWDIQGDATIDGGSGRDSLDSDDADLSQLTLSGIEVFSGAGMLTAEQVNSFDALENIRLIDVATSGVIDFSGKSVRGEFTGPKTHDFFYWYAADGDDVLNLTSYSDDANLSMGAGNDLVFAGGAVVRIDGMAGNDTLHGSDDGYNVIWGDGADEPTGSDDDLIYGGAIADWIYGNRGSDLLYGGQGDDVIYSGSGPGVTASDSDTVYGGEGNDNIVGGMGSDSLFGGDSATDTADLINGAEGDDWIDGGYGNDSLLGGLGNDTVIGGFGTDTIIGNDGDDLLGGGQGSDLMMGGAGNDYFNGGFGYDRLNGGAGADRFYHAVTAGHGADWIQDFSAVDMLVVPDALRESDFQVNFARTPNAGSAAIDEAFVIYRPTGQIIFALVDGGALSSITLRIDEVGYDLLT